MFGGISAICPQSPSVGNHFQEVAATIMVNTNEIKITTPDNLSYVSIFIAVCFTPPMVGVQWPATQQAVHRIDLLGAFPRILPLFVRNKHNTLITPIDESPQNDVTDNRRNQPVYASEEQTECKNQ